LNLETKTILITVKAYPNPSKRYSETVCCAGVDMTAQRWVRLYPIPFRDLGQSQKFQKYNIIKLKCQRANDRRVESYKVNSETIEIIDYLNTKKKWLRRKQIVLPLASLSYCQILEDIAQNKSFGMFKPSHVNFHYKKSTLESEQKRQASYAQLSFLDKRKKPIEEIPFDFYYSFTCSNSPNCPGHKLPIMDWEIGQSYRSWRYRYKDQNTLLDKIRERWLERMCSEKNDVYFYVGNMKRFHDHFMVLGVFYPPK